MQPWHQSLVKLAWPAAFFGVLALGVGYLDRGRELAASDSVVKVKSSATVVHDLRELARLETLALHVEKVVDVTDEQRVLFGRVPAEDSLVFVAVGEVVLGVDLGRLAPGDVRYDASSRSAVVRLPPLETFSARLDEDRSYVHSRHTGLLATRNEKLEGDARRVAVSAFEKAAGESSLRQHAKQQTERALQALLHGFGVEHVTFEWSSADPEHEPPVR